MSGIQSTPGNVPQMAMSSYSSSNANGASGRTVADVGGKGAGGGTVPPSSFPSVLDSTPQSPSLSGPVTGPRPSIPSDSIHGASPRYSKGRNVQDVNSTAAIPLSLKRDQLNGGKLEDFPVGSIVFVRRVPGLPKNMETVPRVNSSMVGNGPHRAKTWSGMNHHLYMNRNLPENANADTILDCWAPLGAVIAATPPDMDSRSRVHNLSVTMAVHQRARVFNPWHIASPRKAETIGSKLFAVLKRFPLGEGPGMKPMGPAPGSDMWAKEVESKADMYISSRRSSVSSELNEKEDVGIASLGTPAGAVPNVSGISATPAGAAPAAAAEPNVFGISATPAAPSATPDVKSNNTKDRASGASRHLTIPYSREEHGTADRIREEAIERSKRPGVEYYWQFVPYVVDGEKGSPDIEEYAPLSEAYVGQCVCLGRLKHIHNTGTKYDAPVQQFLYPRESTSWMNVAMNLPQIDIDLFV